MGDRALVIFTDGKEVSPTVYLHWSGSSVPALIEKAGVRMQGRLGDVSYAAARFVGICHEDIEGNLSLGIWNTPRNIRTAILGWKHEEFLKNTSHEELLRKYSQGDAGLVIVNADDFTWKAYGGYLVQDQPVTPDIAA